MTYYESITIEELPSLGASRSLLPVLLPTSIDEEDDPRSLLYIFDDSDVQRAAALFAVVRAEAEAEAEAQLSLQQEKGRLALEKQLEHLLDQDEAFVDLIGRRLLAINGYDVPDIWSNQTHWPSLLHSSLRVPLYSDIHDDWDLDWLGQELLSSRQGANVWIIESDSSPIGNTSQQPFASRVEEHDEFNPDPPVPQASSPSPHAATVTSEAEESLLETQGQLVDHDDDTHRPRKSVKVTDLRSH